MFNIFSRKNKTIDLLKYNSKKVFLESIPGCFIVIRKISLHDANLMDELSSKIKQKSNDANVISDIEFYYEWLQSTFQAVIIDHNMRLGKDNITWSRTQLQQISTEVINEITKHINEAIAPNPPQPGK